MNRKQALRYAAKASVPVMAGYIVLGAGFGILLQSKGYSWWWAAAMSLFIYAGSMQYVAIDLLGSGAGLVAAALMTVMVNVRHVFYGITMLEKYKGTGKRKPYLIFSLTDETFSLVCSPNLPQEVNRQDYYLFVSLLNQCYWVFGSIMGAILGNTVRFNSAGVDFSMTALFVVIFVEQWEKEKNHLAALTGIFLSVLCLIIFGADDFLIPAMGLITVALLMERKWLEKPEESGCKKDGEGGIIHD